MWPKNLIPRIVSTRVEEALSDSPVVLVHGPRQCGKTTLARVIGERHGYRFFDFDDAVALGAAREDPISFVAELPDRVVIDEVQKAPEILPAIKRAVDRDRTPGRFLLSGSANLLFVPQLSESLTGRIALVRMHSLGQVEIERSDADFLGRMFGAGFGAYECERMGAKLIDRICAGGYPAALDRSSAPRRRAWYRDYLQTLIERDLRDLSRIGSLDTVHRLATLLAEQTSRQLNVSGLASPFQVSRTTIAEYVTLLEKLFVVAMLSPWHNNALKRALKTRKVHVCDTGVACALANQTAVSLAADRDFLGQLVESFVAQELRVQVDAGQSEFRMFHYRDKDGVEVDFVLEAEGRQFAAIEVKSGSTVRAKDFRGLKKLQSALGDRFVRGVLLHDGEQTISYAPRLVALPISALWTA